MNDKFELYDLKVETVKPRGKVVCSHKVGDYFYVFGENLVFSKKMKDMNVKENRINNWRRPSNLGVNFSVV